MRSTAAILLGAAVETVILTSAVALSAYNLLTGKGKDPQDATEVVEEPKPQEPEKPVKSNLHQSTSHEGTPREHLTDPHALTWPTLTITPLTTTSLANPRTRPTTCFRAHYPMHRHIAMDPRNHCLVVPIQEQRTTTNSF
ncbi:MAG: hypothetical protein BYD32DRAFT_419412 [Podila humilis]|nr:MAG: hypothetical protein BYD32DRAFT_419412 [Podila humilis]